MTATSILMAAIVVACLLFVYKFSGNLLRFLVPGKVRHRPLDDRTEPEGPLADELKARGFKYLGARSEGLFLLWSRSSAVYVMDKKIMADFPLPLPPTVAGGYLLTAWPDGSCALTRAGGGHKVEQPGYRSTGLKPSEGIEGLIRDHAKNESVVGLGKRSRNILDMDQRLEQAAEWYEKHARSEFALPAAIDFVMSGCALGVSIYALVLLW